VAVRSIQPRSPGYLNHWGFQGLHSTLANTRLLDRIEADGVERGIGDDRFEKDQVVR
jgi:hypothetical protein